MLPGGDYVRDTGLLQLVPKEGRAEDGAVARLLVRRLPGWRADQDGIVPVVQRLDLEHRLLAAGRGVVAGPLPKRSLRQHLLAGRVALDNDLRVSRDGEAGDRPTDDPHRLAPDRADPLVLADAVGDLGAGGQEYERVATEHHGHRAGLAPVEVLLPLNASVLAWRDVVAETHAVMDHDAVGAQVDPAVVRIAGDVERAGPDVPATVQRVPLRGGEHRHVDVSAREHVLEHGAVLDFLGRHRGEAPDLLSPRFGHLHAASAEGKAQGQRDAVGRAEAVYQDLEPRVVARDLFEQGGRRLCRVLQHVGGGPDLLIGSGATDTPQLPEAIHGLQPLAQAAVDEALRSRRCPVTLDGGGHP